MGFRKGAYATVWSSEGISNVNTKIRISISRKDRETGEYTDEFSGFVSVFGSAAANKALSLKKGDRIQLGDVDVRSKYVKEKNVTYYNFSIFSFEIQDSSSRSNHSSNTASEFADPPAGFRTVDAGTGDVDNGEVDDSNLPF